MGLADYEHVLVTTREEWRAWLNDNADRDQGIWLVVYRRHTERPAPTYEDIVCEALCFGWIDSTVRTLDDERSALLLTPRKPTSTWSASNKARLDHLLPAGLVTQRGLRAIDVAKANGSWTILEAVDSLEVPDDLAEALSAVGARETWDSFTASARKQMLWQVISAKRPTTRAARITRIADEAAAGRKAWS